MGPHTQTDTLAGERQGRFWRTRLQTVRLNLKLTLKEAAEAIGISDSYLNRLEHGSKDPPLRLAYKIAECYHIPVQDLWNELLLPI
jgi:DNA-binding XRE family transcriptional regulator